MRAALPLIALVVALAAPASASESAPQLRGLADAFATRKKPVRAWLGGVGLAWSPLRSAAFTAELGLGWGEKSTGLFGETNVWHLSSAGHLRVRATDGDVAGAGGVLFGYTSYSLVTAGLAAGVQVDVGDGFDFGPVLSGRLGFAFLTLRGSLWLGLEDEVSVGGLIGVELFGVE